MRLPTNGSAFSKTKMTNPTDRARSCLRGIHSGPLTILFPTRTPRITLVTQEQNTLKLTANKAIVSPPQTQPTGYDKLDLERVGIPYRNDEGFADFHASGRHTHITELVRNGATLPEAQALARHSCISMTMKYVHIGIEDQAKALQAIPAPANKSCQDIVRKPGVSTRQSKASTDTNGPKKGDACKRRSPAKSRASDGSKQDMSAVDADSQKAEDTGLEPAAPKGVPQFQCGRSPIRLSSVSVKSLIAVTD